MQTKVLSDLVDLMAWLRYEHAIANGGKPRKPESYPTPWNAGQRTNKQTIGKGVHMTVEEFNKFYYGGG